MSGTYSSDQIDWLRPPEVEGEHGHWTSRWVLELQDLPGEFPEYEPSEEVRPDLTSVALTALDDGLVRLEIASRVHPLDPEGYPLVDAVLRWIDAEFGLILINGAERDKWRPFR